MVCHNPKYICIRFRIQSFLSLSPLIQGTLHKNIFRSRLNPITPAVMFTGQKKTSVLAASSDGDDPTASTVSISKPTIIICPGNGCTNIKRSNWYGHLQEELERKGIPCVCENFPDPNKARREKWIPFIHSLAERCESGEKNVILVGHSSGAQATLRYAEQYSIKAAVLVSATYSDLGDRNERESGYYPQKISTDGGDKEVNMYNFEAMKGNCPLWYQFHSNNDPFIPLNEAERIRDGLGLKEIDGHYCMLPGRSHFFEPFSELTDLLEALYQNY
mmetsp:Transcript_25093/g.28920  ORF Transcript_25093/g.28920 Transcript_25093/m.28920 type:complete len:275 (+) Transcript_25093:2-826(+)